MALPGMLNRVHISLSVSQILIHSEACRDAPDQFSLDLKSCSVSSMTPSEEKNQDLERMGSVVGTTAYSLLSSATHCRALWARPCRPVGQHSEPLAPQKQQQLAAGHTRAMAGILTLWLGNTAQLRAAWPLD